MGFGRSKTPVDREYTLGTHVEDLEALLLELSLRDITLVMQDGEARLAADLLYATPTVSNGSAY